MASLADFVRNKQLGAAFIGPDVEVRRFRLHGRDRNHPVRLSKHGRDGRRDHRYDLRVHGAGRHRRDHKGALAGMRRAGGSDQDGGAAQGSLHLRGPVGLADPGKNAKDGSQGLAQVGLGRVEAPVRCFSS